MIESKCSTNYSLDYYSKLKLFFLECGQPKCGYAVNDGNDPFAVFNQGFNYNRPLYMEKNAGSVDLRIVGGKDARPTKWPFILSLHKNGMFKCGATIIDENWILTAAHCVQKFDEDHGHFQVKSL